MLTQFILSTSPLKTCLNSLLASLFALILPFLLLLSCDTEIPPPELEKAYTIIFYTEGGGVVATLQVAAGQKITKPAVDPTREGYTFVSWYKDKAFKIVFNFETETINKDITIYAKWEALFTVSFEVNGGSTVTESKVAQGKKATKPADNPTRVGYTFVNWYKDKALTTVFNFETETISKDITLYAKWEALPPFTVSFEVNGGSTVTESKVAQGKKATKPADNPTRVGYTFVNWYKDKALTTVFNFETETISKDITLYAKWEALPPFTVSFEVNGGSTVTESKVAQGKKATKPADDPTRANYTFLNWYKDKALTTVFNFETETISKDITLYAKWAVLRYSITFVEIGTFRGPAEFLRTRGVASGTALDLSIFDIPPYGLVDLYTDEKGEQKFDRETVIEADRTLYIKWEAVPRTKAELKRVIRAEIAEQGDKADLNLIDMRLITDMSELFRLWRRFNGDISGWNVAAVTDMSGMFDGARSFNRDISGWNVAAVTDMNHMFSYASAFNGDISGWDVSSVTNMRDMFRFASAFNVDISGWNVAAVTDMNHMFFYASTFNGDISGWNVAAVTDMNHMFESASAFNGDISRWNVAAVRDMNRMFGSASAFNGDISRWNVAAVRDMNRMFLSAIAFNQDISGWDVSSVTNMRNMFRFASAFNGDISGWNVGAVTDMSYMFYEASTFNQDIGVWNVGAVTDMSYMFYEASAFNRDLENWDVASSVNKPSMFTNSGLIDSGFTVETLPSWYRSKVSFVTGVEGINVPHYSYWFFGRRTISPPDNPKRVGYAFDGWYKEVDLTNAFDFSKEISKDITLYAKWEALPPFTVSFEANGGSTVTESKVAQGGKVTRPADDPKRVDYTFVHWYKDKALTTVFNFETETISKDITLYAKWEALPSFTVSFEVNRWSPVTESKVAQGKKATKPADDPKRVGYTFVNWYKDKALKTVFNFETETINKDITLYAKWEAVYRITFVRIGNLGPRVLLKTQEVASGTVLDPSIFDDIPPYELTDLYTNKQGTQVFKRTTVIEADRTLYVKWEAVPRTKEKLKMLVNAGIVRQGYNYKADLNYINTKYMRDMSGFFSKWFTGAEFFNVDISGWNVAAVTDMSHMFENAHAFNGDISGWNVAAVTNMSHMFDDARSFNRDISGWNVATVTNMSHMFSATSAFNGDISGWNVAAVTNMSHMFDDARSFNRDISGWNVAAVTDMSYMFYEASAFNGDISGWNVAAVRDMRVMFYAAHAFNRDISGWNVAAVRDMRGMFYEASAFNGDISGWNVAAVTDMRHMFYAAHAFNRDISGWNVAAVRDMRGMFSWTRAFNQDIGVWNVGAVTDMSYMFEDAHAFNQDISGWNVAAVTNMSYTFSGARSFNRDISGWNVATVTNMSHMFSWTRAFNQDIGVWNVAAVTDMSGMFYNAYAFNQDISGWNVAAVTDMRQMFYNAIAFNRDLENWDVASSVDKGDIMFRDSGLTEDAQPPWYRPKLTFVTAVEGISVPPIYLFAGGTVNGPLSPTREGYAFQYWSASEGGEEAFDFNHEITTDITLYAQWNKTQTVVVTFEHIGDRRPKERLEEQHVVKHQYLNQKLFEKSPYVLINLFTDSSGTKVFGLGRPIMNKMTLYVRWEVRPKNRKELYQLISAELKEQGNKADLNFIDMRLITDMSSLFQSWERFNGDISGWNVAAVTDMSHMFSWASAFNQDISGWNVAAVTDMKQMFRNASAFNQGISGWNVAAVTDMSQMFRNASAFNQGISGWNVAAVTDMSQMFQNASAFNQDISGWNVGAVTNMRDMFQNASAFNQDLESWKASSIRFFYKVDMFTGSGVNKENNNIPSWY